MKKLIGPIVAPNELYVTIGAEKKAVRPSVAPLCVELGTGVRHLGYKGLPTARKTGLFFIDAEYVAHCDSDDWVEPDMYEKMYASAALNHADMVINDNISHRRIRELINTTDNKNRKNNLLLYLHKTINPYVWTRLTRTDIYIGVWSFQ